MKLHPRFVALVIVLLGSLWLAAPAATAFAAAADQAAKAEKKDDSSADKQDKEKKATKGDAEDKVVTTKHTAKIQGQEIKYTATAGKLAMKSDDGKTKAYIFFIAYTKDGVEDLGKRPITFAFNGGPGSS